MATGLDERLERYAAVAVEVGANVEAGQIVFIGARVEHAPLARALTRASYKAGARYVDVYMEAIRWDNAAKLYEQYSREP